MATQEDVRRIALSLPAVTEGVGRFQFLVAGRAFVWSWLERLDPKRARVPNPDVIAIWVGSESEKGALIDLDPTAFFTEAHYDGYPAILTRLPPIDIALLERLLVDGWRLRAPKRLLAGK